MKVYLIHFDRLYKKRFRHYIGYTADLDARLKRHRQGRGARILRNLGKLGIGWNVVRTWDGDHVLERALKRKHSARRLCPVCRGEK